MPIMCRAGDPNKRVMTLALHTLYRQWKAYKEEKGVHPRKEDIEYSKFSLMQGMLSPIMNNFWVMAFPYTDDDTWHKNLSVPMIDNVDLRSIMLVVADSHEWKNVDDAKLLTIIREFFEGIGYKNLPAFKA